MGEDRKRAIRHFNSGKASDFDLEATLGEFASQSVVRQDLRQMFMEILVSAACSSGTVSAAEQQILARVASMLRIPAHLLTAMLQARQSGGYYHAGSGSGQYQRGQAGRQQPPLQQAYAALGLDSKASDGEIKKAYRKLVSQYHPDKLVSRGLPEEMTEIAKKRVREINTAYDQIKQTRGFK